MVRVRPFAAIRPTEHHAVHVASVPYDVVSTEEARSMAEGNPASFLHVVRPEIDLPVGTDPHDDAVYDQARAGLQRLLDESILVRDAQPRMFLYRQVMNHRQQIGLVCCCHIEDYLENRIKKHEKTRPDKEDDRTRHVLATNANAGPIFLTYPDQEAIDKLVDLDMNDRPLYHFNADDGVTHSVWPVRDASPYIEAFAQMPAVYVADGHHRSASAARAGAERRAGNPAHTGDEEYNWFLTVLFPASQLTVLAYNRVVRDLGGKSADELLAEFRAVAEVVATDDPVPNKSGCFCIYLAGAWHRLTIDPTSIDQADPIASLDVALLHDRVLTPLLGIGDPRTDQRIDFVGGIRGTKELEKRVDSGEWALAVSMYPTSIEQLMRVADADMVMPPKSTWFEPKLRSGLLVHSLD